MRITCFLPLSLLIGGLSLDHAQAGPPEPLPPLPSPRHLSWQEDELTVFVHFGINTYTSRSTGHGNEDPAIFYPTNLDCAQWVRTAKECGFKGIILTAKHHDGFCLWPTETTDFSVKRSQWKDGKGDVVRELAEACKAGGVKFGLYCSPWDRNAKNYESDPAGYAELYRKQLSELLSNYGPVYEMWFDGNRANVADWPNVIQLVRRLQPDAVIKQGPRVQPITEDVRWVGNEVACAPLANWSVFPPPGSNAAERIWFPMECDTMMIGHWFWNGTPPRDLATLLNYYYVSVGRGSILLLNVAPNKEGRFSDESVTRLQEFRKALDQIFGTDLAFGKAAASNVRDKDPAYDADKALDNDRKTFWATDDAVTNAWLEVDLGATKEFNVIRLEEPIELGQRVAEYKLEVWEAGAWKEVNRGFTIGNRKLDRFPKVNASKVRLTILAARACPLIRSLGVHLDTISPSDHFEPAKANAEAKPGTRAPRM